MADQSDTSRHLETLHALQRVSVHVVARARSEATGRFSLRVTPGGHGTPEFGDDLRRVRVAGTHLVVESDRSGEPFVRAVAIPGATLARLATFAEVDLSAPLDVGHDTPPVGDVDVPIEVDVAVVDAIHRSHAIGAAALDLVAGGLATDATPTLARLWPEHFDVAIDVEAREGVRVNLGVSPGDGASSEPYAYVGPWTDDRPGDPSFWNAPFGAARPLAELGDDAVRVAAFFEAGLRLLSGG